MESTNWKTLVDNLVKQGKLRSSNVIQAMQSVSRTKFLPPNVKLYASSDMPLQIGYGQTICAPSMVGIINEALQPQVGNKILEVGAGSGWHAATLAEIVAPNKVPRSEWGHVYTIEVVQALADTARKNIINAGFGDRVTIITGDGSKGCTEKAPFDRIVVAAACPNVPKLLVDQLKDCGILLVPIESGNVMFQKLKKVTKSAEGKVKEENLGGVTFLPLAGEHGLSK